MQSRHLLYITLSVGISVIVARLVDYQFNAVAARSNDGDQLTAFIGFWLSNLSVLSLLIQLFVTGPILRKLGVIASLLFLPVGILAGSVAILLDPRMWSAVFVKVADGGFKQSIHKSGMELLSMPVPSAVKRKTKPFIDVFVDSFATGLGGLFILSGMLLFQWDVREISILSIVLVALWLLVIRFLRPAYINAFREALRKRSISLEETAVNLHDAGVWDTLQKALESENERQIVYALKLVEGSTSNHLAAHLRRLSQSPSRSVRRQVYRNARSHSIEQLDLHQSGRNDVTGKDYDLRVEATRYMIQSSEDPERLLQDLVNSEDVPVQVSATMAAALCMSESGDPPGFKLDMAALLDTLLQQASSARCSQTDSQLICREVARVIGVLGDQRYTHILEDLMNVEDIAVRREVLLCLGRLGTEQFLPFLIDHIGARHYKVTARRGLALFGDRAMNALGELLEDRSLTVSKRREIVRVLRLIGSSRAVQKLVRIAEERNPVLRSEALRSLHTLKKGRDTLRFPRERLERLLFKECENYLSIDATRSLFENEAEGRPDSAGEREQARLLLLQVFRERMEQTFQRIFLVLGVLYSPRDLENAYQGARSLRRDLRANSLEFLDNMLKPGHRSAVFKVLERTSYRSEWFEEIRSSIERILNMEDQWLKACMVHWMGTEKQRSFLDVVQPLVKESDIVLRETAEKAVDRLMDSMEEDQD
ncbi:hypothetical protein GF324_10360 [bacterium]|nr:hypothetical protein [bacterium]